MKNKMTIAYYRDLAVRGRQSDIDAIMKDLNKSMTIAQSKFIDFALGHVVTKAGINRMTYYLFNGTQIQRNYCALYFGRMGEYKVIREAYEQELIDGMQAFSR